MSNFEHILVGNKAKGRTSKRVLQENKARQVFQYGPEKLRIRTLFIQ